MKPDRDLIEKFLKNQSTDAEAAVVEQYFKEHPDEVEQHIPLKHWMTDNMKPLAPSVSERMLRHIREAYTIKRPAAAIKKLVRYSVAASIAGLVVFMSLKLFTGMQASGDREVVANHTEDIQALKTIENKTGQVVQVKLPDSSVATIYPNSSLEYLPVFQSNRRDLYLHGKALFAVSKDTSRPFTVYAMGVATTALGTRFEVNANAGGKVQIKLFEGKVVIRPENNYNDEKVYLTPGQQLEITKGFMFKVSNMVDSGLKPTNKVNLPKPNANKRKPENKLSFRNSPLLSVFGELERKFNVHFTYPDKDRFPLSPFTGQFKDDDSLEDILKILCQLNSLRYKVEGNTVTVSYQ